MLEEYLPQTAADYIACFRSLAAMTSKYIDGLGDHTPVETETLKRLAEAIETLSSLRGDSDLFINARPAGLDEYQKEMYSIEYGLRQRLLKLGYVYPIR